MNAKEAFAQAKKVNENKSAEIVRGLNRTRCMKRKLYESQINELADHINNLIVDNVGKGGFSVNFDASKFQYPFGVVCTVMDRLEQEKYKIEIVPYHYENDNGGWLTLGSVFDEYDRDLYIISWKE